MVRFFPELYPDEILYSLFARYHLMSKVNSASATMCELFGTDKGSASLYYYPHLDYLCKQLPDSLGYSAEYLVLNHTVTPYFFPFMTKDRYLRVLDSIQKDCSNMKLAGIQSGGLFSTNIIKICPKCVEEDISKYDEAYIHRQHQMPGNFICKTHELILHEYSIPQTPKKVYLNIADVELHPANINLNKEMRDILAQLYILMEGALNKYFIDSICNTYRNELFMQGYYLGKEQFDQRKLKTKFKEYYSNDFLNFFKSNFNIDNSPTWINRIISLKSKDYLHPIRHLLFINFLFGNVYNLASKISKNEGSSLQWQHVNKNEMVARYTFWTEWDNKLLMAIENGITNISELCRIMKSCRKTIIYHAKKMGVIDKLKTKSKLKEHNPKLKYDGKIDLYKHNILEYINYNPKTNRTLARKVLNKEITFILKAKPEWLDKILPVRNIIKRNNKPQIDWCKRDTEYEKLVKEEIQRILVDEKPVQILKHTICRSIGIKDIIYKYSGKLPLTINAINEGVESYSDFIRRKIRIELYRLKLSHADFSDEKIIRKHFRNMSLRKHSDIIFDMIDEIEKSDIY